MKLIKQIICALKRHPGNYRGDYIGGFWKYDRHCPGCGARWIERE